MAAKSIRASVIIGGSITGAFRSAMSSTKGGLKAIGEEITNVERKQRLMGRSIDEFGRVGKSVDGLRRQYSTLAREADRLRAAQSRLASVQSRIDANTIRRREIGGQLRGAVTTVGAVAAAAFFPVREAVSFENAMLGVAKQVDGARDASGKLTSTYFKMGQEIRKLGHELPISPERIADLVTAGARMGVASRDLIGFARSTAMMATAFEMSESEIGDSMGKIAGIFKIPIPAIGELGDAINHLDDKTMSTGASIIRVMQGDLAGAATTMGLSAKNAAALASTFLTLGESAERADTAAAGMLRQLQVAKMNPKRFQVGVEMIGLTADKLQKGMIADPQAMILDVLGRIKKLPIEQQMEAVTRLFGKDWGGAIAKLANGVDEYRKQIALANGEAAKGSMSREFQARMQTTSAQWQITKNRISDVAVVIGGAMLPAVNDLMKSAGPMIDRFGEWSRENPGMIKGVVGSALALSGLRVVTLGVGYAWAAIKTPVLSVMGFIARWRATGALAAMGRFGPVAMRAAGALRLIGTAVAAIGGGPVALAVAALTAGALIVRKYWQPIRAWMSGAFEGVREVAGPAFAELGSAIAALKPAWDAMSSAIGQAWNWVVKLLEPVNLTSSELAGAAESGRSFGRIVGMVMGNTVRAITFVVKAVTWIGQAIGTTAGFLVVNFTRTWDKVKSVVGAAVDWIMRKIAPMLSAAGSIGAAIASGANMLGFGAAPSAVPRAAVAMPAPARGRAAPRVPAVASRRASSVTDSSQHVYHITQQPGESGEALAKRIEDERRRRAAVARRGSLVDVAA